MKIKPFIIILAVILLCSAALAENGIPSGQHMALIRDSNGDMQHMALIRDGDLGDKQIPVALICAAAVVVGVGVVYVHKKRRDA